MAPTKSPPPGEGTTLGSVMPLCPRAEVRTGCQARRVTREALCLPASRLECPQDSPTAVSSLKERAARARVWLVYLHQRVQDPEHRGALKLLK